MNDKEIKKFIRTGLLLGIGAASVTKNKINKLSQRVTKAVKQGNLNEKEGKETLNRLLKKSKAEQQRIEKILNSALKDIAKPYTKRAKKKIFKKGRRN